MVKIYTAEGLKSVLDAHRKWLEGDSTDQRANLRGAYLYGANLKGANLPSFSVAPEVGGFTAFKQVRGGDGRKFVLQLLITSDTPRVSSLVGRKCRAKEVVVVAAFDVTGAPTQETEFRSTHDLRFVYNVGDTVVCQDYDDDIRVECTKGIHFFMTRKEAQEY